MHVHRCKELETSWFCAKAYQFPIPKMLFDVLVSAIAPFDVASTTTSFSIISNSLIDSRGGPGRGNRLPQTVERDFIHNQTSEVLLIDLKIVHPHVEF